MQNWVPRVPQKLRRGFDPFIIGGYFFSFVYAALIVIPLFFVIVSAFKSNSEIISPPLALPASLKFQKVFPVQENVNVLRQNF